MIPPGGRLDGVGINTDGEALQVGPIQNDAHGFAVVMGSAEAFGF